MVYQRATVGARFFVENRVKGNRRGWGILVRIVLWYWLGINVGFLLDVRFSCSGYFLRLKCWQTYSVMMFLFVLSRLICACCSHQMTDIGWSFTMLGHVWWQRLIMIDYVWSWLIIAWPITFDDSDGQWLGKVHHEETSQQEPRYEYWCIIEVKELNTRWITQQ